MTHVKITANDGSFFLIDEVLVEDVTRVNWGINNGYVRRSFRENGKRTSAHLHVVVMALLVDKGLIAPRKEDQTMIDHEDGDRRNNTMSNLRFVTPLQNSRNRDMNVTAGRTAYKGVYFVKKSKRWAAHIGAGPVKDGKASRLSLGCYRDPKHAALASDRAARKHFGEFARPNFPEEQLDDDSCPCKQHKGHRRDAE